MRPERLSQLNIPMTQSGIEPATFRLVAQCLTDSTDVILRTQNDISCNALNKIGGKGELLLDHMGQINKQRLSSKWNLSFFSSFFFSFLFFFI
jgi:hypothetical protein